MGTHTISREAGGVVRSPAGQPEEPGDHPVRNATLRPAHPCQERNPCGRLGPTRNQRRSRT